MIKYFTVTLSREVELYIQKELFQINLIMNEILIQDQFLALVLKMIIVFLFSRVSAWIFKPCKILVFFESKDFSALQGLADYLSIIVTVLTVISQFDIFFIFENQTEYTYIHTCKLTFRVIIFKKIIFPQFKCLISLINRYLGHAPKIYVNISKC